MLPSISVGATKPQVCDRACGGVGASCPAAPRCDWNQFQLAEDTIAQRGQGSLRLLPNYQRDHLLLFSLVFIKISHNFHPRLLISCLNTKKTWMSCFYPMDTFGESVIGLRANMATLHRGEKTILWFFFFWREVLLNDDLSVNVKHKWRSGNNLLNLSVKETDKWTYELTSQEISSMNLPF